MISKKIIGILKQENSSDISFNKEMHFAENVEAKFHNLSKITELPLGGVGGGKGCSL